MSDIDPLIHDKLYELLHTLVDELAGYSGYEDDAADLRHKVITGFEKLDNAIIKGEPTVPGVIVGGYIRTAYQIRDLIEMARAEKA